MRLIHFGFGCPHPLQPRSSSQAAPLNGRSTLAPRQAGGDTGDFDSDDRTAFQTRGSARQLIVLRVAPAHGPAVGGTVAMVRGSGYQEAVVHVGGSLVNPPTLRSSTTGACRSSCRPAGQTHGRHGEVGIRPRRSMTATR